MNDTSLPVVNLSKNNFDFLRYLFAFSVLFAHINELNPWFKYRALIIFEHIPAVPGFFIVSGFLIVKSYESYPALKQYLIKRTLRIVPAYSFWIIIISALLYFTGDYGFREYFGSINFLKYLGANLLYQNYLQPCLPGVFEHKTVMCAVNGALWTLKIEEAFYIVLPALVLVFRKFCNKKIGFWILIYILSLVYMNVLSYKNMPVLARQLPGMMAYFTSGILTYYLINSFLKFKNRLVIPAIILFVLERYYFTGWGIHLTIFTPLTFSIIIFYVAFSFPVLNNFGKYGNFTLGIFIVHFPLIQTSVFFELFLWEYSWTVVIVITLLSLFLGILSWLYLEKPVIEKYRRHLKRTNNQKG